MLVKTLKIVLIVASILYPVMVVFFSDYVRLWLFVLAFLFLFGAILDRADRAKNLMASIFFGLCALFYELDLKYLYPSLVSLAFLFSFGISLRSEAIITRIARLKNSDLNSDIIAYTRALTKIWCLFFAVNASIAFWLSMLKYKEIWAIYTGVVSYILMGVLFMGELFYRYKILKARA